jgi:hypothetical protein
MAKIVLGRFHSIYWHEKTRDPQYLAAQLHAYMQRCKGNSMRMTSRKLVQAPYIIFFCKR